MSQCHTDTLSSITALGEKWSWRRTASPRVSTNGPSKKVSPGGGFLPHHNLDETTVNFDTNEKTPNPGGTLVTQIGHDDVGRTWHGNNSGAAIRDICKSCRTHEWTERTIAIELKQTNGATDTS